MTNSAAPNQRKGPAPNIPDAGLAALVAEGYRLFKRPPPGDLAVCTDCCMPPQDERRMLATAQDAILLLDLREWFHAAFGSNCATAAVKFLLPRTLEFMATGIDVHPLDPALTLRRLADTCFPEAYTDAEVTFLNTFAATYLTSRVNRREDYAEELILDDLLCLFAQAGFEMTPLLSTLDACETDGLIAGLCTPPYVTEIGWTAFWDKGPAQDAAVAWYLGKPLQDRLFAYFMDDAKPEALREAAMLIADDILDRNGE